MEVIGNQCVQFLALTLVVPEDEFVSDLLLSSSCSSWMQHTFGISASYPLEFSKIDDDLNYPSHPVTSTDTAADAIKGKSKTGSIASEELDLREYSFLDDNEGYYLPILDTGKLCTAYNKAQTRVYNLINMGIMDHLLDVADKVEEDARKSWTKIWEALQHFASSKKRAM
eukprot:700495-Rhodomonas_salina.1